MTRLRADLPARFLDDDLHLEADLNQGVLARQLQVQRSVNDPPCTRATSSNQNQRGCSVTSSSTDGGALQAMIAGLSLAAAGIVVRRVRRRR